MRGFPGHPSAILLVEDDPGEVRLLQEAFTAIPVHTQLHVVHNGREALAFLRRRRRRARSIPQGRRQSWKG